MKVNTSRFGEVEVEESMVFNFIEPIIGYEHLKLFIIVDHMPDSPFKWLQSAEDPNTAFPITIPSYFNLDYEFLIPEEDAKKLDATSAENLLTLNIVRIPNGKPQEATINLIGPVIINLENKKAMQLVLLNTNYSVRHALFPEKSVQNEDEKVKMDAKG